jgi:hypothetical protein
MSITSGPVIPLSPSLAPEPYNVEADARAYADRHGLAFVEGWDVVAALG